VSPAPSGTIGAQIWPASQSESAPEARTPASGTEATSWIEPQGRPMQIEAPDRTSWPPPARITGTAIGPSQVIPAGQVLPDGSQARVQRWPTQLDARMPLSSSH